MGDPRQRSERPLNELRLELESDATPEAVEAVAKLFRGIADAHKGKASFTMVVSNLVAKARLRAWDEAAAEHLELAARTIEHPLKSVRESPAARALGLAIVAGAPDIAHHGGVVKRMNARRAMQTIDRAFVKTLGAAVEATAEDSRRRIRGTTEFRTPVLRVGRVSAGKPMKARLVVEGSAADFSLAPSADVDSLFEAARTGGDHYVAAQLDWVAEGSAIMQPEASTIRVISARRCQTATGEDIVAMATISRSTVEGLIGRDQED